ncbi:MAG: IclR family transcriptional regulator [Acidimicrobiales bacterium]
MSPPEGREHQTGTSGALGRGLRVLTTIARHGPMNVAQISGELAIPRSSVYRIVRALRASGLVVERRGDYAIDGLFWDRAGDEQLGERVAQRSRLILRSLAAVTGATADVLVRSGHHAVCVQEVAAATPEPTRLPVGDPMPLHAGAEHRVLLAFAPAEVIDEVLVSHSPRLTSATLSPDQLVTSLAQIRQRGFAVSRGEYIIDAVAVGAPVRVAGRTVCSVGVAGPRTTCGGDWARAVTPHVRRAAAELAESLSS